MTMSHHVSFDDDDDDDYDDGVGGCDRIWCYGKSLSPLLRVCNTHNNKNAQGFLGAASDVVGGEIHMTHLQSRVKVDTVGSRATATDEPTLSVEDVEWHHTSSSREAIHPDTASLFPTI
jgi:hypothetical protein